MNLNKHYQNIIEDKYYGRNYGGQSAREALKESKISSMISSPVLLESVAVESIIGWFHEVKKQLDVLVSEVYSGDDAVLAMLHNVQAAFNSKHPDNEIDPEDLKRDLDHIYHVLSDYRTELSGSLKQYVGQLADTVKTISLDSIETNGEEGDSKGSMEDSGDFMGSPVGGMGSDDMGDMEDSGDLGDSEDIDDAENSEEFDFEKELEDI